MGRNHNKGEEVVGSELHGGRGGCTEITLEVN